MAKYRWLIGYAVLIAILAIIPLIVKSPYYLHIFIIVLVNAILGITFIILMRTGLISLGIATFWGIGAYTSAVLVTEIDISFWLSLPATTVITALVALIIGYILIGSGSSGLSFVILSSIIGMVFPVTVGNIPFVGGYNGITGIPKPDPIIIPGLLSIEFNNKTSLYYLGLFLFVIVTLACSALYASSIGRAWSSIGLNKRLAESIGINVTRYRLLAFIISSAIAGFIGSFYAHYTGFIIPDIFNMFVNVYIQIYAIFGGIGYVILGPLLGSAIMTMIPETMRMAQQISYLLVGVFLVVLIMFLPRGLLGLFESDGILRRGFNKLVSLVYAAVRPRP